MNTKNLGWKLAGILALLLQGLVVYIVSGTDKKLDTYGTTLQNHETRISHIEGKLGMQSSNQTETYETNQATPVFADRHHIARYRERTD